MVCCRCCDCTYRYFQKVNQLILHKKTGFKNLRLSTPILIRDFRGVEFYSTIGLKSVDYFNLPEGCYFIDSGLIGELDRPVHVNYIEMPTAERWMKSPENFSVNFGHNPNKCTIDWETETITFDNSFQNAPLPNIYFILFHEFGHALYTTERFADMFAANKMLSRGFNMSQIGKSSLYGLSSKQFERKNNLINRL
jgi:hypothetical protein